MKNKRSIISIAAVLTLAALIACLVFYRNGKESQTVVVIKDSNVESYETAFETNLQDGNYLNTELDSDGEGHFEGNIWLFRGNSFYPYIENADGQEIIITNADITVVRDDTVKLGEQ